MKPLPRKHKCPSCGTSHNTPEDLKLVQAHHSLCLECGELCPYSFMAKDAVWKEAKLGYHDGVIHLACLAERLGRPILDEDLTEHEINGAIRWGWFQGVQEGRAK